MKMENEKTKFRTILAAAAIVACLIPGAQAFASAVAQAPLPAGSLLIHPGLALPEDDLFTVRADLVGFTLYADLDNAFTGTSGLAGSLYSAVYKADSDSHLLFAYMVTLGSASPDLYSGSITGIGSTVISDAGIVRGGSGDYAHGDIDALDRGAGTSNDVAFSFWDYGGDPLIGGEASAWFFLETGTTTYESSTAAMIGGSGSVASGVNVLVPGLFIPPPAPGDANGDGSVDLQDFGLLKASFGTTGGATWAMGDFNNDGNVDLQDFGLLKANFGTGGVATVPEPATLSVLLLGGLAMIGRKTCRKVRLKKL